MSDSQLPERVALFFEACNKGDLDVLRGLLANDLGLVRIEAPRPHHHGWTGLHEAAKYGQVEAVRLLLQHGADPNARETGDNTYPLHWAAAHGHLETVRALLDAGGDVQGIGDVHDGEVIGWASHEGNEAVIGLLLQRGGCHHIFSAMALGDRDLVKRLVEENPECLSRRRSRFEGGQTPLHAALGPPDGLSGRGPDYAMLDLLIELGADVEAKDDNGRTPLSNAMLRGDREAMRRLKAAGAEEPQVIASPDFRASMAAMSDAIKKGVPMITVPDVARALAWYTAIGFEEIARYEDDGLVNFGMVSFGKAELMLNIHGTSGPHDVSLWFYTDQIDTLYQLLKSRQLEAAKAALAGEPGRHEGIEFQQDIADMFYGARQFGIRDLNGYLLYFIQSVEQ